MALQELNLTGIPEVDQLILLSVDDERLFWICQGNEYLQNLCADDYFSQQRVLLNFGEDVVQNKPYDITYRKQYAQSSKQDH
jgi:hypothetical protein